VKDFPVERALRDVRVTRIYEGTSEIQRTIIGKAIANRYAPPRARRETLK